MENKEKSVTKTVGSLNISYNQNSNNYNSINTNTISKDSKSNTILGNDDINSMTNRFDKNYTGYQSTNRKLIDNNSNHPSVTNRKILETQPIFLGKLNKEPEPEFQNELYCNDNPSLRNEKQYSIEKASKLSKTMSNPQSKEIPINKPEEKMFDEKLNKMEKNYSKENSPKSINNEKETTNRKNLLVRRSINKENKYNNKLFNETISNNLESTDKNIEKSNSKNKLNELSTNNKESIDLQTQNKTKEEAKPNKKNGEGTIFSKLKGAFKKTINSNQKINVDTKKDSNLNSGNLVEIPENLIKTSDNKFENQNSEKEIDTTKKPIFDSITTNNVNRGNNTNKISPEKISVKSAFQTYLSEENPKPTNVDRVCDGYNDSEMKYEPISPNESFYREQNDLLNFGNKDNNFFKKQSENQEDLENEKFLKELDALQEYDLLYDEENNEAAKKRLNRLSHKILIKSNVFNVALGICTFYSIFSDDIKKVFFKQDSDLIFDILIAFAILTWVIELYCKLDLGRQNYVKSLPFFLDAMSGLSLIADISLLSEGFQNSSSADKAKFSRAGRSARLGTNVARVIKLTKLCKFTWLTKYFSNDKLEQERKAREEKKLRNQLKEIEDLNRNEKLHNIIGNTWNIYAKKQNKKTVNIDPSILRRIRRKDYSKQICDREWFDQRLTIEPEQYNLEVDMENGDVKKEEKAVKPSKLATSLSYRNTKRMILCCLSLLMGVPTQDAAFYFKENPAIGYDAMTIGSVIQNGLLGNELDNYCENIRNMHVGKKVSFQYMTAQYADEVSNKYVYHWVNNDTNILYGIRNSETVVAIKTLQANETSGFREISVTVSASIKKSKQTASLQTICKTFTVCFCLTMTAIYLSGDQAAFILTPMQRLSSFVHVLMKNPSAVYGEYLIWKEDPKTKLSTDIIEYHIIQLCLIKIAAFLGAAHGGPSVNQFCNPLVKQKKNVDDVILGGETIGLNCIFVIVGIRNMPEVVDVLGEELTLYVNRIFDIVGEMTYRYEGQLSSHRETKLLLMWKLQDDLNVNETLDKMTYEEKIFIYRKKVMLAIVSILKSLVKIYCSSEIDKYSQKISKKMITNFVNKSERNLDYAKNILNTKETNKLLVNSRRDLVNNNLSSLSVKQSSCVKEVDEKIPIIDNKSSYNEKEDYKQQSMDFSNMMQVESMFVESVNKNYSSSKKMFETIKVERHRTDYREVSHKAGIYSNKSVDRKPTFLENALSLKNKRVRTENTEFVNKFETIQNTSSYSTLNKKVINLYEIQEQNKYDNLSLIEKNSSKKQLRKKTLIQDYALKSNKHSSKYHSKLPSKTVSLRDTVISEELCDLEQVTEQDYDRSQGDQNNSKINENIGKNLQQDEKFLNEQNGSIHEKPKRSHSDDKLTSSKHSKHKDTNKLKISHQEIKSSTTNCFQDKFQTKNSPSITNNAIIINTGNSETGNQKITINNKVIRNSSKKINNSNEIIINNTIIINDIDDCHEPANENDESNDKNNKGDVIEHDQAESIKQMEERNEFQMKNIEVFRSRIGNNLEGKNVKAGNLKNKLYNLQNPSKKSISFNNADLNNDSDVHEQLLMNIPKRKIVSFGMHIGSCEQTALGSFYQCYPYFHSKDINIAGFQQKSNEVYNTYLIFTNEIHNFLPNSVKDFCRQVDNVMLNKGVQSKRKKKSKDTEDFYSLYTMESYPDIQKAIEKPINLPMEEKEKQKTIVKDLIQEKILLGCTNSLFMEENDIQSILSNDSRIKFFYTAALDYYILGEFEKSIPFLKEILKINPHDGPSIEMLGFIIENNYEAPHNWRGCRNIKNKLIKIKDI